MSGLRFVAKTLAAEETELVTGEGMMSLGDLREVVRMRLLVPEYLQRCSVSGRSYGPSAADDMPLAELLRGLRGGVDQERHVWLLWMRDNDCIAVFGGGMFLENELERKRARMQALQPRVEFEYLTLRAHKFVARRAVQLHEECTSQEETD